MNQKIVVIGGVAAGASAAAKARRVNERAEVVLYEKGPYVSFANCGLPYFIGNKIQDRDSLFLQTPEGFWKRYRVKVHVLHEVLRIDRSEKKIDVKDLKTGQVSRVSYDKLILAPGAGAVVPPFPGIQSKNIFTVKTVPDSDAIKDFILQHSVRKAVVVGGGFIGLETAEALAGRGIQVTVIEMLPQILPPFDPDMAAFVSTHLEEKGIHLVLADGVKAFHGGELATEIELQSGRRFPLDLAILSIGVRPELALAKDAGLLIGEAGGISVDDAQRTSDPDIYAAGDVVEVVNMITGRKTRMPLAGIANKQGRVAGANAAGDKLTFPGAIGTAIVESMGIIAAKTGLSEADAKKAGLASYISLTHSLSHAGYYPGGELLHLKIVAEKTTGRLLGAQIVGEQGVDKRIDVLATAIGARLTVTDLENLDLAYAPQFSSAKDPVIMAGFVASNIGRQTMKAITCDELKGRLKANPDLQLIDVRSVREFSSGHLENARLIPIDELRERVQELDPKKETVVYCKVGFRGYLAARILQQLGFDQTSNLAGGILVCQETGSAPAASVSSTKGGVVDVHRLKAVLAGAAAVVLDVRDEDEVRYEHIEGTTNAPFDRLHQAVSTLPTNKEIFVLCQSGVRSPRAIEILSGLGVKPLFLVEGGINAWRKAGYPLVKSGGPIPVMRQVQIVAGSLAFLGGLIPGLRWVAILVGAGLVFAGVSGFCGMAVLLDKMPWNRGRFASPRGTDRCGSSCD